MSRDRKEFGLGTLALILGLLPTVFTTQISGVSLLSMITEAMSLNLPDYAFAAGLILSVPGAILGWAKREDYGAVFGAVICSISAIFTIISLFLMAV